MKLKRYFLAAAAIVLCLVGGAVVLKAQQVRDAVEQRFRRYDLNADGKLTQDEVPAPLFKQLDLNQDGSVTLAESLRAVVSMRKGAPSSDEAAGALATRLFRQFDADDDGGITREESGNAEWFDRLDRDKDNRVSLPETLAVAEQIKAMVQREGEPAAPVSEAKPVLDGPLVLKAADLGVGRQVGDVSFTDTNGTTHQLSDAAAKGRGVVFAFTSVTCPVSKRYTPSLVRHAVELEKLGIMLVLVNPFPSEETEAIRREITSHQITAPYVHDKDRQLASALGARSTTEVFFVDEKRTLLYRGALDDQYGIHYNLDAPKQRFLMDAVEDHLAGRVPHVAATEAPGCELELSEPPAKAVTTLTFHRDISRILQQNCVECHREGGLAPFSLEHADEVVDRAKTIRRVIEDGTMPPWFAKPLPQEKRSPWMNDRSLSARDRADLLAWLNSSERALGDVADAPVPLVFDKDGWKHGRPDLALAFSEPIQVKAEGQMPYKYVTVETGLTEDKWIQGYQIIPGDIGVVHHALAFLVNAGKKERLQAHEGFFAAYVPGAGTEMFPAGFAKKVPAGSRLVFQMHYTPNGRATEDRTRIGLYFSKSPPVNEVKVASVSNRSFEIPAGAANHQVIAQRPAPFDMTLMSFMPHMHVRGKSFRYEIEQPQGIRVLLDIPRYDFNWQLQYRLSEPLLIPRGTMVRGVAHFDNSAANKANPDPTRNVRWGDQTDEEMMIGYIEYYTPVTTATASN